MATGPVDFRKGIDGLALAVQEMFGLDPFCGAVFVFRAKRADRIKLLVWDQTGMVLVHKRLEGGKFVWAAGAGRGDADVVGADWRRCSRGWTGGWCAPSGRGVRWRQGERADVREAPVLAGQSLKRVIHSGAWTPTPSAARTPT